jgi:hypothetical protein
MSSDATLILFFPTWKVFCGGSRPPNFGLFANRQFPIRVVHQFDQMKLPLVFHQYISDGAAVVQGDVVCYQPDFVVEKVEDIDQCYFLQS